MKLADMTVTEFVDTMASDAPAPGGGSAAAIEGALGTGLIAMVCALTIGKKKYAEVQELAASVQAQALLMKDRFTAIIDLDTEAFNGVSAVFAMPRDTDEQKAARKAAMQEALKKCTDTPMEMMRLSLEGMKLIESICGKLNASAASDLGCAVLSLRSAVQGAWLNVLINVGGLDDAAFADNLRGKGQAIIDEILPLADRLYAAIQGSLQ